MLRTACTLLILLGWLAGMEQAQAGIEPIFSEDKLLPEGTTVWGNVADGTRIPKDNPFSVAVDGVTGLDITVSQQIPQGFFLLKQNNPAAPLSRSWNGNFGLDDVVAYTRLTSDLIKPDTDTTVTLELSAPVAGLGLQFQPGGATGPFDAILRAFDSEDNLLGEFSAPGESTRDADDSAVFLGVLSDSVNIGKVEIDVRIGGEIAQDGFAFSGPRIQVSLRDDSGSGSDPDPGSGSDPDPGSGSDPDPGNMNVAEPSAIVPFVVVGLAAVGYCEWIRRRKKFGTEVA